GGAQRELRVCERAALLLFGLLETPSPATMASPSPIPSRVRSLFIVHIRPKVSARYFAIRAERPESPPQMGRAQAMRHRMFLSLHPINPLAMGVSPSTSFLPPQRLLSPARGRG